MTTTAMRLSLPCPGCDLRQILTATVEAGPCEGDAGLRALVRECPRCWSRRARALNEARAELRARGELGRAGLRPTWRGALLHGEDDALQGALLSELLRRGFEPSPRHELSLRVRGEAAVVAPGR